MRRLNNKTCVVTGAARGIGRAIAACFHDEGAVVIVTDIDEATGAATAAEIGCRFEPRDVREEADWLRLAGRKAADAPKAEASEDSPKKADGTVTLTPVQITAAGIELVRPTVGDGGGTIELPATIEGDPQETQVVPAALAGCVVTLTRNLGQSVARGTTLAVIESREAAQLKGDVEAARARLALANSNLAREQRLFDQRVSPEQDLVAARTVAIEARIAYRQAQGQVAATGASAGALNRIAVVSPIAGEVITRSAVLGQTVAADAELYRVARLDRVSLSFALSPADAGRVRPGGLVTVTAPGRQQIARISFVSPALDPDTKLVSALATLDNRGGRWRVGESVSAAVELTSGAGGSSIRVPSRRWGKSSCLSSTRATSSSRHSGCRERQLNRASGCSSRSNGHWRTCRRSRRCSRARARRNSPPTRCRPTPRTPSS